MFQQYNCPTEHVDLQGRTALHDAGKQKFHLDLHKCLLNWLGV